MTSRTEKTRRAALRKTAGLARNSELEAARRARLSEDTPRLRKPGPYMIAYACFACRKSFKRRYDPEAIKPCPQCGVPSADMGRSFKAPRKTETRQWQKVERLWKAGYRFHTNTRPDHVPPFPGHPRDVDQFITDNPRHPFRLRPFWPEG